jgi:hypothetical protein
VHPETQRIPPPPHEQSTIAAAGALKEGFQQQLASARATAVSGAYVGTAGLAGTVEQVVATSGVRAAWSMVDVGQSGKFWFRFFEGASIRAPVYHFFEGTQGAVQELSLGKAAEIYTGAFAAAWGRPTWNEVTVTEWEGERTYRFTVTVTPEEYEDVEGRLKLENQVHGRVEKEAPDYAGFFAIRYKPTDDHA